MQRPIEAVVWDLDGTLVDSSVVVPDAFVAAVMELEGPMCSREEVIAAYDLGPPPAVLSHLLGRPSTEDDLDAYHRQLARTVVTVRAYPGIEEALEALGSRYPMGVFTGASRDATDMLLDHSGLGRFFYHIVSGDETEHPKPHPDGLHKVAASMEIAMDRIAYIGDSRLDAEAARRAGAYSIAAGWGHLHEVGAEADLVCLRPSEILDWVEANAATD